MSRSFRYLIANVKIKIDGRWLSQNEQYTEQEAKDAVKRLRKNGVKAKWFGVMRSKEKSMYHTIVTGR